MSKLKTHIKNKNKKPLEGSLGKAPFHKESENDLSHLCKPFETSIGGIAQVINLFLTATDEVKNYINYECDVMYECRMCRTIFRSVANFILHKRRYCSEKYNPTDHTNCRNNCEDLAYTVIEKEADEILNEQPKAEKSIVSVLNKLVEKQQNTEMANAAISADLSNENNLLTENADNTRKIDVLLEKIESNQAAVFQTLFKNIVEDAKSMDHMKDEVMEIHGILDTNEAIIGSDGKVHQYEPEKNSKIKLVCTECDLHFSTKKTLTYHIKYKHNKTRQVYPCPTCKETFANPWCVYRHLYKVHRKTSTQIRKLRSIVHNSVIQRAQHESGKQRKAKSNNEDNNDENQWLDNMEEDIDLQMCGGCGKRFERKAALHSHSALCSKRLAVCNSIKENMAKKKEDEKQQKIIKEREERSASSSPKASGAAKRKPSLLMNYKTKIDKEDLCSNSEESMETCSTSGTSSPTVSENKGDINKADESLLSENLCKSSSDSESDEENPPVFIKVDFRKENALIKSKKKSNKTPKGSPGSSPKSKKNKIEETALPKEPKTINWLINKLNENRKKKASLEISKNINMPTIGEIPQETFLEDSKSNINLVTNESPTCSQSKLKFKTLPNPENTPPVLNNIKRIILSQKTLDSPVVITEHTISPQNDSPTRKKIIKKVVFQNRVVTSTKGLSKKFVGPRLGAKPGLKVADLIKHFKRRRMLKDSLNSRIVKTNEKVFKKGGSLKTYTSVQKSSNAVNDCKERELMSPKANASVYFDAEETAEILTDKVEKTENIKEKESVINSKKSSSAEEINVGSKTDQNEAQISPDAELNNSMYFNAIGDATNISTVKNDLTKEKMSSKSNETLITINEVANTNNSPNKAIINEPIPKPTEKEDRQDQPNERTQGKTILIQRSINPLVNNSQIIIRDLPPFYNRITKPIKDSGSKYFDTDSLQPQTKTLKRKRVNSLDATPLNEGMCEPTESEDALFMAKASPFMNTEDLICIPCKITYGSLPQLLWHMSMHFTWYRYQCSKCPFLSFNMYDCRSHASSKHRTGNLSLENVVLPIPKWRILLMSTDYKEVDNSVIIENFDTVSEEPKKALEVEKKQDTPADMSKDDIMEVILGNDSKSTNNVEIVDLDTTARPIRNRTQSVKTKQNDFIYDLNRVLLMNRANKNGNGKSAKEPRPRSLRVYSKQCKNKGDTEK